MASVTVRISEESRNTLREISESSGQSMQSILEQAIDDFSRRARLEEFNRSYEALRKDPEAWAELERERAIWDNTLLDGLELDEIWTEDGNVTYRKKDK